MSGELTVARVQELLHYDVGTGVFTWRAQRYRAVAGAVAGKKHCHGYIMIGIERRMYQAHRLAWFIAHGSWPDQAIDHINGDPADNRLSNLRLVGQNINVQNIRKAKSHNRLGILGVVKVHHRYQSTVTLNGVKHYLGTFKTAEEAHQRYLEAKRLLHPGCTI